MVYHIPGEKTTKHDLFPDARIDADSHPHQALRRGTGKCQPAFLPGQLCYQLLIVPGAQMHHQEQEEKDTNSYERQQGRPPGVGEQQTNTGERNTIMQENNASDTEQNPGGEDATEIEAEKRARDGELTRRTWKTHLHQVHDEYHNNDQSKYVH